MVILHSSKIGSPCTLIDSEQNIRREQKTNRKYTIEIKMNKYTWGIQKTSSSKRSQPRRKRI